MAQTSDQPHYRRILLATDGSAYSAIATGHALYLAERTGAELTVLYVMNVDYHVGIHLGAEGHELAEEARRTTGEALRLAETTGVTARALIVRGEPRHAIVNVARREQPDLLVVGAQGLGALERVLLGSTSTHVVQHAPCPVLVVRT
ncbi:MAG: universal stress protein [Chloroflexi bacterium]|nr:universal stress protein [Chloroflexota bacterium]